MSDFVHFNTPMATITMREVKSGGPSDTTDRTADIQAALNASRHVYLGPGLYMVSGPIDIADDTHLQLHPLAVIKRSLSMPTSTQMIRLAHAQRVLVEGGSLDGNKQSDVVGAGGQCTGLATAGATDVEIRNMQIYNWPADPTGGSYGYGIYLGSRVSTPNTRVRVSGVNIYGCEQNNMFLVSGKDIIIENSRFANSNGHEPGSGLDIEPNDYREVAQNVIVRNCVFEGNNDGVTCNNHWGGYWHDITFDGCTFRGNRNVGISCTGANLPESRYVLHNCKFLNNGGSGLYIAGTQGADISGCRAEGNAGLGIEMSDSRDFTVARNQIHNNLLGGVGFSEYRDVSSNGFFLGNSIFNNALYGVDVQKSLPSGTSIAGLVFGFNSFGNANYLKYPAWTALRTVIPDFRILNDGNIYECITAGTTAASTGPTTTSADIEDGDAHWKYIGPQPVQTWPVNLNGEAARGAQFLGNTYEGHTVANNPREQPQGDAVTLQTAGIVDSLQTGQSLAPMSRSRAVAFEDKSGTPGDVTTRYAAGIVAIPAATIDLNFDLQTSNFTNGRTVTGATSGATGVIASQTDAGATGTLRLTSVTGNFIDDEIITDTMTGSATVNGYGRATVKITTPFASVGDMVHVTPLGLDDTLNGISASVSADAVITVQGRGVATATYPLSFEIIKKGSFAYDL